MKLSYKGKTIFKRALWWALAIVFAAALAVRVCESSDKADDTEVFGEGGAVFAVTVNLTGNEREADKRLLYASLSGCGVSMSIFCDCDYIEEHQSELAEAVKNGNSVCLLLSLPEDAGKYDLMRYIASENDRFFSLTGKYPAYARTTAKPSSEAIAILEQYGQLVCNDTALCTSEGCEKGSVIELSFVDSAGVCALLKEITERLANGCECAVLSAVK